jgi:hypothetical protein
MLLLAAMLVGIAWATVQNITTDESLPKPQAGGIVGTITPAERIQSLELINRATGETWEPDTFDEETGEFSFDELPGDATYDLEILTTDGAEFCGIDLSYVDSELMHLAQERRKAMDVELPTSEPFTMDDAELIAAAIAGDESFTDHSRYLYLEGQGDYATVLVELLRDTPFHDAADDVVIWRVELWYFQRINGAWGREQAFNRVVDRRRLTQEQWNALVVSYLPELSVTLDRDGESPEVRFELPETVDPETGRVGPQTDLAAPAGPIFSGIPSDRTD